MSNLPKAPSFRFVDPNLGRVFSRDRIYDLDAITDTTIERLLKEDPAYWEAKFERIPPPKAKAKKEANEAAPDEGAV